METNNLSIHFPIQVTKSFIQVREQKNKMSQAILKFLHETNDFKATIILKQEKQMKFIVASKHGNKSKYGTKIFIENTPESISNIINSGLIDNLKDFYVVLLGVKNTFEFNEESRILEVRLTFCHRQSVMEILLEDFLPEPEDEDQQKAVSINVSQLPEQLNEQQNQMKKNNGEIYFAKEQTEEGHYQGQMLNGLKHGKGKFFFKTGDLYTGDFYEGFRDGYGQFLYGNGVGDGRKYEGNFFKNQMYGKGKYFLKDGHTIQSFYVKGLANGPGIQTAPNGDISLGIYKNGYVDGKTLNFMGNGDIFEYDQLNDLIQGFTKYYFPKGQILEAIYKDNNKEGFSTTYWPDNVKQEGNYRNDLKHGEFVMTDGDTGEVTKSYWFDGESCTQEQFNLKSASENANPSPHLIQEVNEEKFDDQNPCPGN